MPTTTEPRRTFMRSVAVAGVAGTVLATGLEELVGEEAAAAERKANHRKACKTYRRREQRQSCKRKRRRERRRRKRQQQRDRDTGKRKNDGGSTTTPPTPTTSDPIPLAAVLSTSERHLVNRFSYGVNASLSDEVQRAGGANSWFEAQLEPDRISDLEADGFKNWWSGLNRTHGDLWQRQVNGTEGGWEVMGDYQRWTLVRRVYSKRQLSEVMTEFWLNHLHVPAVGDAQFTHRVPYDQAIRSRALTTFEDLLKAAITHPAMGIFLDNAVSTKKHPNENLGRELLELHTVGRAAYNENDVKNAARILTGYRVDMWKSFNAFYSSDDHWTGPVQVLDFTDANAAADGRPVVDRFLSYLARHPQTAQRIARKLAVRFVRDSPSQSLVDHLAGVYLANGTAIKPVLRALVDHAEFKGSAGMKVRDPAEDVVASYRVLGAVFQRPPEGPGDDKYAANAIMYQSRSMGLAPYDWARPDGAPASNQAWATPARIVAGMEQHWNLAGRWWPKDGVTYLEPRQWLPAPSIRFDELVSHLSRVLLNRPATPELQRACSAAVGITAETVITRDHGLVKWNMHRLLVTFLDSPTHMMR